MHVSVDEARRQEGPARLDNPGGLEACATAYSGHTAVCHQDIGPKNLPCGWLHDLRTPDQQVARLLPTRHPHQPPPIISYCFPT